ncbi:hypothetical protein C7M84_000950 [Penaeus vannamei]|uniref:Uncharacterized protein n=1 Tax=Penaeus vannamei TaxID=6689 RepID=A0A3R7N8R6_PENVA|nr:hypothetical protein C7M84_000950 [Penaeus vannamei]
MDMLGREGAPSRVEGGAGYGSKEFLCSLISRRLIRSGSPSLARLVARAPSSKSRISRPGTRSGGVSIPLSASKQFPGSLLLHPYSSFFSYSPFPFSFPFPLFSSDTCFISCSSPLFPFFSSIFYHTFSFLYFLHPTSFSNIFHFSLLFFFPYYYHPPSFPLTTFIYSLLSIILLPFSLILVPHFLFSFIPTFCSPTLLSLFPYSSLFLSLFPPLIPLHFSLLPLFGPSIYLLFSLFFPTHLSFFPYSHLQFPCTSLFFPYSFPTDPATLFSLFSPFPTFNSPTLLSFSPTHLSFFPYSHLQFPCTSLFFPYSSLFLPLFPPSIPQLFSLFPCSSLFLPLFPPSVPLHFSLFPLFAPSVNSSIQFPCTSLFPLLISLSSPIPTFSSPAFLSFSPILFPTDPATLFSLFSPFPTFNSPTFFSLFPTPSLFLPLFPPSFPCTFAPFPLSSLPTLRPSLSVVQEVPFRAGSAGIFPGILISIVYLFVSWNVPFILSSLSLLVRN